LIIVPPRVVSPYPDHIRIFIYDSTNAHENGRTANIGYEGVLLTDGYTYRGT